MLLLTFIHKKKLWAWLIRNVNKVYVTGCFSTELVYQQYTQACSNISIYILYYIFSTRIFLFYNQKFNINEYEYEYSVEFINYICKIILLILFYYINTEYLIIKKYIFFLKKKKVYQNTKMKYLNSFRCKFKIFLTLSNQMIRIIKFLKINNTISYTFYY